MFAIRLLTPNRLGADGERLGEIVVGEFREGFVCHLAGAVSNLEASWRPELAALVRGAPVAILQHDPRVAWLVYREGRECFVQQRLSLDGTFGGLVPRVVTNEDGDAVSTWVTSLAAVQWFLDAEPGSPDAEQGAAPNPAGI
ncbi:MAG: hypothetical protein K1X57_09165 [Gemmataceae bacterium]|nr:hypothetical protein [Gemmataceae bacterium]